MALVYSQSTTQDVNQTMAAVLDIDYQQQRDKSVEEATNSGCYEQPLCFYDENSSFNTTVADYLPTNTITAAGNTHEPGDALQIDPSTIQYPVDSNDCHIYNQGLRKRRRLEEEQPSSFDFPLSNITSLPIPQIGSSSSNNSDDICSLMEPIMNECNASQGLQPQSLNWRAYMVESWYTICDPALQEITHDEVTSGFYVEADKGFNFSQWDESFVCQKKNHFQISIQFKLPKVPKYLKTCNTTHEIEHIHHFALHLHGVKLEMLDSLIPVEQSRTDRSKLAYEPIRLDFPSFPDQLVKASACRLHFSETTANNMRKRGKPNPDQRYFALVVAIHAYTTSGNYPIVAYVSERIIVRASNPGQFDNEGDSTWLKGASGDVVFYQGKVGINTEAPDEALTVVGNIQVTGQILQPSDLRLKTDIEEVNTSQMLDNVRNFKLYSYSFKPNVFNDEEDTDTTLCERKKEVGLLAQEVALRVPDAVGRTNFKGKKEMFLLNKDRILMECIGAIQELTRVEQIKRNHIINIWLTLIISIIIFIGLALIHNLI